MSGEVHETVDDEAVRGGGEEALLVQRSHFPGVFTSGNLGINGVRSCISYTL